MAKSKRFNIENVENTNTLQNDIFGEPNMFTLHDIQTSNEKPSTIKLSLLKASPRNPYNVDAESEEMKQLVASIKEEGILTPLLARPKGNVYEVISGHRRKKAAELAGLEEVPVFVRELSDEEADRIMVDMNLNRENILPSEKARAIKLKYDAIKKSRGRKKASNNEEAGHNSAKLIAEEMGMSDRAIQEYIRLTHLSKYALNAVDKKQIPQKAGTQLSFLPKQVQDKLATLFIANGVKMNEPIAKDLKDSYDPKDKDGKNIEKYAIDKYVSPKISKKKKIDVPIPAKVKRKYFPEHYTDEEIDLVMIGLLNKWAEENNPDFKK